MRVANIDMTNTSQNCPSGLRLISSPKRVCDITSSGCVSNNFDVYGPKYSNICGRVISYQKFSPNALVYHSRGIDGNYVYGVSLTHGQSPRQHIWTFTAARDESSSGTSRYRCPCVNPNLTQLFLVLLETTTSVILPLKPIVLLYLTISLFKSVILSGMVRGVASTALAAMIHKGKLIPHGL